MTTHTPLVLVDMDGVQAGFESSLWDQFEAAHPGGPTRADADPTEFYVDRQLGEQYTEAIHAITNAPGFFANLPVIDGAAEALNAMLAAGWDVRICTAPLLSNPTCASEKLDWLDRHLGAGWASRALITRDKTLVRGDILIDDKPEVTGDWTPIWKHVVFDAPYNQDAPSPYRLNGWSSWHETLIPLLGKKVAA